MPDKIRKRDYEQSMTRDQEIRSRAADKLEDAIKKQKSIKKKIEDGDTSEETLKELTVVEDSIAGLNAMAYDKD